MLLDLPLSLALTRVVLVSVNGEVLAIPTTPIRRILGVPGQVAAERPFATVIEVDGETIPLAPLASVLGAARASAPPNSRR